VVDGKIDYTRKSKAEYDGQYITGIEGDWILEIYGQKTAYEGSHAQNNGWKPRRYPNLLNKDAVSHFINITYKAYAENLENFSENIYAIFTDEPSLMTPYINTGDTFKYALVPWEDNLPKKFMEMHNYDITEHLNSLYNGDSEDDKQVRVNFYQTVSQMLKENYFGQLQKWCEQHGVKSSGHALLEEKLSYQVPLYGDLMKVIGAEDIPGVDVLTGVPEAYLDNLWFLSAKYVSSAARLQGKKQVMFEYCPVEDGDVFSKNHFEYTLGTMGLLYLNGANYANSYYSIYDMDKEKANVFNEYVGRLGYMLDGAEMNSGIAIYYPIETAQAEYKPLNVQVYNQTESISTLDNYLKRLSKGLLENKLDFNFVSSEYINQMEIADGTMKVGDVSVSTIIMPRVKVIPLDTLKKIILFEENGGKIIWLENLPEFGVYSDEHTKVRELIKKYNGKELSIAGARSEDNLARNAKVSVSSVQEHELYSAENLVDGKNDTDSWNGWASTTTPAWIEVDLGSVKTINKAILYGKNGYEQKDYNLQYWNNGFWINLIPTVTDNKEDIIEHCFQAINTRKIRITMSRENVMQDSNTGERVARWNEIELYNDKDGNNFDFYDLVSSLNVGELSVSEINDEQKDSLMMSSYTKKDKQLNLIVNPTDKPITALINGINEKEYFILDTRTGDIDTLEPEAVVTVKPYMSIFVVEK